MTTLQLWLPASEQAWLIESGSVDVFAVPIQKDGRSGAQRHLLRLTAGQVVFGVRRGTDSTVNLLARSGADSVVRLLTREQIQSAPELAAWLDGWIRGVVGGLVPTVPPKGSRVVNEAAEFSLNPDETLRGAESVRWVRLTQGVANFLNQPDLPFSSAHYFPLVDNAWVQCPQASQVVSVNTATALEQNLAWPGLEYFHRTVATLLHAEFDQQHHREHDRLERASATDKESVGRALTQLAAVMRDSHTPKQLARSGESLLLTACRLIGEELHLEMREPFNSGASRARRNPLEAIAQASRLRLRRVALRGQWWRQDNGPLLAYLEADKSPVALVWGGNNRYVLIDPATSERRPVAPQIAQLLEPFAYTFFRSFPARLIQLRDLLQFGLHGSRSDLLNLALVGAAIGVVGLVPALITTAIFDTVIPTGNLSKLWLFILILVTAALASGMFQLVRSLAVLRIETRLGTATLAVVWDRLLTLPVTFFAQYTAGDLATRVEGLEVIRQLLAGIAGTTILTGIFSIVNFGLLFYLDVRLAGWATVVISLALLVTMLMGYASLTLTRSLNMARTKIAGLVFQLVTAIARLRVTGAETRAFVVWAERFAEQRRLAFQARTLGASLSVFNAAFPHLALVAIFMAVVTTNSNLPSTGVLLAFLYAFGGLLTASLSLSSLVPDLVRVASLFEQVQPILRTVPEVAAHQIHPGELNGHLEVSHATFRYKADGPIILNDVSLSARPGEFVAIVGASGSGKSTLLRLLLGFEFPEAGAVYYDGQDLATLDVTVVRNQIGVVLQNGKLIPGDIFSNIIGSSLLTLNDAWEAARLAGLEADIKLMPMGMHTLVSEGGATVSDGQRQRLMIARAIVNRPRLIFFDEATSALDNRTQAIVSQSLESLQATRIVIAHRLSTILNADRIYVMDKGQVVQTGSYAELAQADGLFHDLIQRQII
jgi:NHLM bacteriocin system ABC transporter ATP-binding protein